MRSHLLNDTTTERYKHSVMEGIERVATRLATTPRPFTGVAPDALALRFEGIDLDRPLGTTTAALDELEEVYLRDAVYFHHPRYLAHLNCPVVIPAVLGEAVLSAVNSSLDTWDQSAGGTLIERRLIEWTAARIGLGPTADGVFTSGGTQSNLQALLLAREECEQRATRAAPATTPVAVTAPAPATVPARTTGTPTTAPPPGAPPEAARTLRAVPPPPAEAPSPTIAPTTQRLRVLASDVSHFSVRKAAKLLGLAPDAVIAVPSDGDKRMDTAALAAELERCVRGGLLPMAVVATAGTTDFGSIDPLPEIADLCARYGTWLHVDAAYGCGLLVSHTRRRLLDGIERADSVTVDYHKSFFQPVSSSAVLVRDAATLRHATYHADYLNPRRSARERVPNQVDKSLQTTRRFDALKLWMTLRIMGADAVGALFDEVCELARTGWRLLAADPRFDVVVRPQLSTLVFRCIPQCAGESVDPVDIDRANLHARKALLASGDAVVAGTRVDGRHYLKFTLLNPETTADDIAAVLDLIAGHAEQYLGEHLDRAS